jgi:subtilisin family serine protease
MTDAPQDFSEVCWEDYWDQTIEQQIKDGTLGFEGDLDNPRGGWVLFTPRRVLVDARVKDGSGLTAALERNGLTEDRSDDAETERARRVADRLGLRLFRGDTDRLVGAVREVNRVAARSASLDHVLIGGPARWGGDSVPVPVADPGTVPGGDPDAGRDITVAVLDTGIAEVRFSVQSATGDDDEVPDEDGDGRRDAPAGHGTHVAGLVASVAAGATIVARRILKGVAGIASDLTVAEGLLDSADAQIINCSFSGPVLDDGVPLAVERALALLSPETVVVACAGNFGSERPQWPAASKRVIAVGAVQRSGSGFVQPDFTSFGSWVDCCAPGVDEPSAFLTGIDNFEGFASWSGTSMSCPQVAGAIAAIASREKIDARTAAFRLVQDPARPRMPGLGAIVDPQNLP